MTDAVVEVPAVQEATAQVAIGQAAPFVKVLMENGLTKRGRTCIHIVAAQATDVVEGESLWVEHTLGALTYDHDYVAIAQGKARVTLREEKPSADVPLAERVPGDPVYWGSIWNEDLRLAVAASGFQPEYDRAVCQLIEANILLLLEMAVDLGAPKAGHRKDGDYIALDA